MGHTYKDLIKSDYYRYREHYTKRCLIQEFIKNKAFRYSTLMRLEKAMYEKGMKARVILLKIIRSILFFNSTIEISSTMEVGKGLYMGHFSGITINPKVRIGNNVNIHKGVTIGQENRGERKGTPNIGDKVWIGINATIVGNVSIGDNVLIAPNSFVNFDVPSNSIVIGNKIIASENATEGYMNRIVQ